MKYKAVLFDLDGVIADTAVYHFEAWKRIATSLGIELEDNFEENLKGVDRAGSLQAILDYGNIQISTEQFEQLLVQKNSDYLELIANLKPSSALPGIPKLFADLNANGIKIAIASASKNAPFILERLELIDLVDGIANPAEVKAGKPAPDIFIKAARIANVDLQECIAIEDAKSGVEAIKAANVVAVSIGDIKGADYKLSCTSQLTYKYLATI